MQLSSTEHMFLKWKHDMHILFEATWCAQPLQVSKYFLQCRGRRCQVSGAKHQSLIGLSKQGGADKTWSTAQAESYPFKFCKHFAKALVAALKQT